MNFPNLSQQKSKNTISQKRVFNNRVNNKNKTIKAAAFSLIGSELLLPLLAVSNESSENFLSNVVEIIPVFM